MSENKHICLALGGARSGKSDFAESTALSLAKDQGQSAVYIATGQAFDDEMKARIKRHLDRRDPQFTTIEEPVDLISVLKTHDHRHVLLIDSIGVWITNLMINDLDVDKVMADTIEAIKSASCSVVLVSDEIGMGIVPENAMSRAFRDHIGMMNQNVASLADRVAFLVAGVPMIIKS